MTPGKGVDVCVWWWLGGGGGQLQRFSQRGDGVRVVGEGLMP